MDENPTIVGQPAGNQWKHGKFDCCEDVAGILCATFLMQCYACQTSEAAGGSFCCNVVTGLFPCCGLSILRGQTRERNNIEGSCLGDFATMYFCGCCSAVQLNREYTD